MPSTITCPNYEVVFSGDDVLLTFDIRDVPFLAKASQEPGGQAGVPVANGVAVQGGGKGGGKSATARFGEHDSVIFPALPPAVEEAIQASGKLWIVGLDGEGNVSSEACLPIR